MAKKFKYEGKNYRIDSSRQVDTGGDIDFKTRTILVDKGVPEKFHEGMAVHEIEERKNLDKGHTYVFSHNEAQKKERNFYEKIYGAGQGVKMLEGEEAAVLNIFKKRSSGKARFAQKQKSPLAPPIIQIKDGREIIFEKKKYRIDTKRRLIGTLVDVCEKGRVVYFDKSVPEKLFEGLVIYELTARKFLKNGLGWSGSQFEADKAEKNYYCAKYGAAKAEEILKKELELQALKFKNEQKNLGKAGGHKVVYEKGEILPK